MAYSSPPDLGTTYTDIHRSDRRDLCILLVPGQELERKNNLVPELIFIFILHSELSREKVEFEKGTERTTFSRKGEREKSQKLSEFEIFEK